MSKLLKKYRRLLQNPKLLAIPLIVFVVLGFIATEWITNQRIAQNALFEKVKFQSSVSQNSFVQSFRSLTADRSILANLDSSSFHSVKQSFKGYLRKGGLKQTWIYDGDCNEVAAVKSAGGINGRCNKAVKTSRLISAEFNEKFYQFIQSPVQFAGKKYLFVASRRLSDASQLKNYKSIGSILQRKAAALGFLAIVLSVGLALLAMCSMEYVRKQISANKELASVQAWLGKQLGMGQIQFSSDSLTAKIEQVMKSKVISALRSGPDTDVLEQKIEDSEALLKDVSFWKPIKRWSKSFSSKAHVKSQNMLQVLEKERTFFEQKKSVTLDLSLDTLERWREGIKQRGARKFLRSLSETKSTSRHADMLMQEINVIQTGFEYMSDAIEKMQKILNVIHASESQALRETAASLKIFDSESYLSFSEAIDVVQVLAEHKSIHYINKVGKAAKNLTVDLHVAAVLLESYQLFSGSAIAKRVSVKTVYKRKDQLHTLILDCESDSMDVLNEEQKTSFLTNVEIAQKVNQGLSVHFSPSLNSLPIVISWQDLGIEKVDLLSESLGSQGETSSVRVVSGQLLE